MSLKEFRRNDIFFNLLETYPQQEFLVSQEKIYYKKNAGLNQTPEGYVDLYELNVGRTGTNDLIYPFVTKDSSRGKISTVSSDLSSFEFGDTIAGSYPLSASLSRVVIPTGAPISHYTFDHENEISNHIPANSNKKYINSLKNTLTSYTRLSHHFSFEHSQPSESWNKGTQAINLLSIPSIFYGSSMKKGSIRLGFYSAGQLIAEISDIHSNGELIETTGSNVGSVAGVAMYDHGFVMLTGSWDLESTQREYNGTGTSVTPKWLNFGMGMPTYGSGTPRAGLSSLISYAISFSGVHRIPTLTMFAHAKKGEFNYSSNPTAVDYSKRPATHLDTRTAHIGESKIKNIIKSEFKGHEEEFHPEAYISKVGIYDEKENLLGFATLATPVKKNQMREYTFKLKLDI